MRRQCRFGAHRRTSLLVRDRGLWHSLVECVEVLVAAPLFHLLVGGRHELDLRAKHVKAFLLFHGSDGLIPATELDESVVILLHRTQDVAGRSQNPGNTKAFEKLLDLLCRPAVLIQALNADHRTGHKRRGLATLRAGATLVLIHRGTWAAAAATATVWPRWHKLRFHCLGSRLSWPIYKGRRWCLCETGRRFRAGRPLGLFGGT
mmetsp:Transcript_94582/g.210235  ORF Transcript_94582/g.210235 Transcript_94582/m.210235 type:complete len:205 (-) Transcript_94582:768-1382(-)